jgi:gamma-glutamylcyclotransferase (GGCT)/AIG2-like uncharacterized protein YtfP
VAPFFIYGTLLPGQRNAFLWGSGIVRVEPARFPQARLYDLGPCPLLVERGGQGVVGALIAVGAAVFTNTLRRLDALEGVDLAQSEGGVYQRLLREVVLANGRSTIAWTYVARQGAHGDLPLVPEGNWCGHINLAAGRGTTGPQIGKTR